MSALKQTKYHPSLLHTLVIIISTLGCGYLSMYLGKELSWDLANYHFYNAYAYWHNRYNIDYWPTSFIQQFLNPTLDFLSYFLVNTFPPKWVEFFLGCIHGINLWLIFIIARIFLPNKIFIPAFLALLGLLGPTTFPGIGSFAQDNLISLFVLGFVYLQVWSLSSKPASSRLAGSSHLFFLSYLLLGLGTGLKLTCGIYLLGGVVANLFTIRPYPALARKLFLGIVGFALGVLITSGYWMLFMWQEYGNPIFPFLNNIFKSPYFFPHNWQDIRFMPKTLWQTLFYPFFFSWDGRIADEFFRDVRFLFVYLLLASLFIVKVLQRSSIKLSTHIRTPQLTLEHRWFIIFFVASYIVWQWYFSMARYLMSLEMLAPLLIYLIIQNLFLNKTLQHAVMAVSFYSLIFLFYPCKIMRAPFYDDSYFNVSLPKKVYHSNSGTILVTFPAYTMDLNPRPQSYLAPFFPKGYQFIGVPFLHSKYLQEPRSHEKIIQKLQQANRPIYVLTSPSSLLPELMRTAHLLGLKSKGACEKIVSDRQAMSGQLVWLCPVG